MTQVDLEGYCVNLDESVLAKFMFLQKRTLKTCKICIRLCHSFLSQILSPAGAFELFHKSQSQITKVITVGGLEMLQN